MQTFGYGSTDLGNIKIWINMAYEDIATRRRWSWLQNTETIAITSGVSKYALTAMSDTPIYWGRLRPASSTAQREPRFIDPTKMGDDYTRMFLDPTNTGTPNAYTIWDGVLEVFPYPDQAYNYTLYYWTGVSEMVNPTDICLIPSQFRNVLVFGALMFAADQDRDLGMWNSRHAAYEDLLKQMYDAEPFDNLETVLKAEMPRNYYGAYDSGAPGAFPRI